MGGPLNLRKRQVEVGAQWYTWPPDQKLQDLRRTPGYYEREGDRMVWRGAE